MNPPLLPTLTHQLLFAFHSTFTQPDKTKRQQSILFIKSLQQQPTFLQSLFDLLSIYSPINPYTSQLRLTPEIMQAVFNWIEKYIVKQYDPKAKQIIRHSRADLLKVIVKGFDRLTKVYQFPHKILILLCKPLSIMVNHQFNQTLKFLLIDSFITNIDNNPSLIFYQLYSILLQEQNQMSLNKIMLMFDRFIDKMVKATVDQIAFYMQVVLMLLKQISKTINRISFGDIVENEKLMNMLEQGVMTGNQMAEIPLRILILLINIKLEMELKQTDKLNKINKMLLPIVYEFLIGINNPNNMLYRLRENQNNDILIVMMIKYFTQLIRLAKDEQQIYENKREILLDIILPLIILPQKYAIDLMNQNPNKYLKIKYDIASAYQMEIIQSAAAELLEIFCDKVDGITTETYYIAIDIIKNTINPEQNPLHRSIENSMFFKCNSHETRLETAVMALCILSYTLQLRNQCVIELENFIQNYTAVLFDPSKPFLSITFLYMLCYYMDVFFLNSNKGHMRFYILDNILMASKITECQAFMLQIYDSIEHIMQEGEYGEVVRERTKKIGDITLSNAVDHNDLEGLRIFEMLLVNQGSNIVANCEEHFIIWMTDLCAKIKQYIDQKQYNQFVVKGLGLFSALLANEDYSSYQDHIFQSFQMYMVLFNKQQGPTILFDQILVILNRYIQAKHILPASLTHITDNIYSLVQNNDNIFNIFRTFCLILTHSKDPLQYLRVYQIALITLKHITTKLRSFLNPLQGTLLMHLAIYHHNRYFSYEHIKDIVETVMVILRYQYIKSHQVMYAKYLLVILQCLQAQFEMTMMALREISEKMKYDCMENFYKMLFDNNVYYDGYDRKMLIIYLVDIVQNKDFPSQYSHISLKTMIQVLFKQYNVVITNVANQYIDSSQDQINNFIDQKKQMQLTLVQNTREIFKLFVNPFEDISEYQVFKGLIDRIKMHGESGKILDEVVGELPVGLKDFLKEYALRVKRVEGEGKRVEKRKIFKVNRKAHGMEEERRKEEDLDEGDS